MSAMKTDAEIQQDVLHELSWASEIDIADVGVTVTDGVVTLTGAVKTYAARHAAQEAAHRVLGVLDVANELEVVLPGAMEPRHPFGGFHGKEADRFRVVVVELPVHLNPTEAERVDVVGHRDSAVRIWMLFDD